MKGGTDHWIPYSDFTASILATIPRTGDLLFPARGQGDTGEEAIRIFRTKEDAQIEASDYEPAMRIIECEVKIV